MDFFWGMIAGAPIWLAFGFTLGILWLDRKLK